MSDEIGYLGFKDIVEVFDHWKGIMVSPEAPLGSERAEIIWDALAWDYSVEKLKNAITGFGMTHFNMHDNDPGRFCTLKFVLGEPDQIDRFLFNYLMYEKRKTNESK